MTSKASTQSGFTLLEVVVVMVIVGIVIAIATPSLMQWHTASVYRDTARTLANMTQEARSRAISEGKAFKFVCDPALTPPACTLAKVSFEKDPDDGVFKLMDEVEYTLAYPNNFVMRSGYNCDQTAPVLEIEFFPNGSAEVRSGPAPGVGDPPATICVNETPAARKFRVSLQSLTTGKVVIER